MKQRHFIDSHKAATGLFVLLLIALYGRWTSPTAWTYLALHGTYGILWVIKSRVFGDKNWDRPATLPWGVFVAWGGLTVYWVAPWLLTWRGVEAPPWYLALCVAIYGLGVFLHFVSDMQKHMWLKLRPGELLTVGLWARVRNPNYLGEFLIYFSFALLALHWAPLALLAAFVAVYWVPNMRRKDRSLSRYPGFSAYRARSWLFLPPVW